ncbi:MAG TPA: hypothetical protein VG144_01725 [Gaiellaceae bacterium]|jgi:hypothetical protein|nr:hypothetical protein [Gaiellaceae bacterium]
MSTSPDDVVNTLSWYLVGRAEREQVEQVLADPDDLGPESAQLVHELRQELSKPGVTPPKLEPLVRETIEAIAHGD